MAVPTSHHVDLDELKRGTFEEHKQHTDEKCKNTSQYKKLEDGQKELKSSDVCTSVDAAHKPCWS